MNHSEAIESAAAAAYTLGELSGAERNAFEMHYIDCPMCAQEVWAGNRMFAAGRELPPQPQPQPVPLPAPLPFRQRAQQWMSVAAAAVFAFVIGAIAFRQPAPPHIPAFASMEVADPHGSIAGIMRGADDVEFIHFEGNRAAEIIITTPSQSRYPAYRLELRDGSEKVLHTLDLSPKQTLHDDGVPVLLRALPAGRYVLVILGVRKEGNHTELARKSVVVQ